MNLVSTLGIDLAKSTFSLHGVNSNGEVVLRRSLCRAKLVELVAQLPPCLIGMEACSGAHEWARRFSASGHTVRLMAAKFVTPYRKSGKNDGNDAEAICEAVARPNMRFVPVKSLEQQSDLTLHRVRQGFVEERTATLNRLRGLLAEFGHVLPVRAVEVHRRVPLLLDKLPTRVAVCARDLWSTPPSSQPRRRSMNTRSERTCARMRSPRARRPGWASDRSPPLPWLPPSVMAVTSRTGGSSLPGLAWCRANTLPVAKRGSDPSPSAATRT